MPEGLTAAMSTAERRDLIRFLFDLGHAGSNAADHVRRNSHVMAQFTYDRVPLHPEQWPSWQQHVNRDRVYDFYAKEAAHFMKQSNLSSLLPVFPGLDGGRTGTGATRMKTHGQTDAGTNPTWARCSAGFSAAQV